MTRWLPVIALLLAASSLSARAIMWQPDPGIYTNEEQVYFDGEAGRAAAPWIAIQIEKPDPMTIAITRLDRFGHATAEDGLSGQLVDTAGGGVGGEEITLSRYRQGTIVHRDIILRRARPATCWVAILKDKPKTDGKEDWLFQRDVKLHDQGGRALVGGGDSGTQPLVIRMRKVVWPPAKDGTPSTNKPSIVLYVHKTDQPDRAESYVWADPGAARIGINLRWMQASCAIDGAETPSQVTSNTFRG